VTIPRSLRNLLRLSLLLATLHVMFGAFVRISGSGMGCGDNCPFVPGLEKDDWALEDPKGKPIQRVREIRDEIRSRVLKLIRERQWIP